MNPESSPTDGAKAWLAAGVPNPPLTDDELFAYASEDFDLVDPREIELELARDPVARHRLRQIEAQILAQRDSEVFEGLAARRIPQSVQSVAPASTPPIPFQVDWVHSLGVPIALHVRRTANALEAAFIGANWRLASGGASAVLGRDACAPASGGSSALVIRIRDRWQNQITVGLIANRCHVEVTLSEPPKGPAILQLEQKFPASPASPVPPLRARVENRRAMFPDCPPGLHHLTGVPDLDVWIHIEAPPTSGPAQP